jgi:hypothetical protein
MVTVKTRALPHFEGLELPRYQTTGSAGMDLPAALPDDEPVTLRHGEWQLIPTGLAIAQLNGADAGFIAVTDVEVSPLAGGEPVHHRFLVIGRASFPPLTLGRILTILWAREVGLLGGEWFARRRLQQL